MLATDAACNFIQRALGQQRFDLLLSERLAAVGRLARQVEKRALLEQRRTRAQGRHHGRGRNVRA
jgi:hypothetical protein